MDTQILSWAIIGKAVRGTEQLIPLAVDFMKWLEKQDTNIIVPSIVIGELLIPVPKEDQISVLTQFNKDWIIVDYDLRAATIFAQLRREHMIQTRFKELRNLYVDSTKKELSADVMIIAAAIAHGAGKIYSSDKKLISLAQASGMIEAENFQEVSFQRSLLSDESYNDEQ